MNSKEPLDFMLPLLKTPHILTRGLRVMFAKHYGVKRDLKRADGVSTQGIQQISIKITNACNLRCKTCGQWGETGYNIGKPAHELKEVVPVERYIQMVDEAAGAKPIYYIWGGEPFLYPDLFKLTAKIKEKKSVLALVTNATYMEEHAQTIVDQGWDALMFSLDGPEEIHDEVRGRKGTFQKVKKGIEAVQRIKREQKKTLPWIMPLITVSTANAHKLEDILEAAQELNTDCAVIYYSWFTDETVGASHTREFEKEFGVTPQSWKGYLFDHAVDAEVLKESRRRIAARKWGFPVIYIPDLKDEDLAGYYEQPGNFFGYGPCVSPWMVTELMPNGDVATCRDYPDFVAGNIMKNPLSEIWNGEKYRQFRKGLCNQGGTFPLCSRCCGLMGW